MGGKFWEGVGQLQLEIKRIGDWVLYYLHTLWKVINSFFLGGGGDTENKI